METDNNYEVKVNFWRNNTTQQPYLRKCKVHGVHTSYISTYKVEMDLQEELCMYCLVDVFKASNVGMMGPV